MQIDALKAPLETSTAENATDSGLADLLREQLAATRAQLRLQTTQTDALRGFAPYLGRFKHGTNGPVIEDGLAYLHRGETVTPELDGPYRNAVAEGRGGRVAVDLTIGMDSRGYLEVIDGRIDDRAADVTLRTGGRRQAQIARAPGRG